MAPGAPLGVSVRRPFDGRIEWAMMHRRLGTYGRKSLEWEKSRKTRTAPPRFAICLKRSGARIINKVFHVIDAKGHARDGDWGASSSGGRRHAGE